jgi:hypothetical protein
VAEDGSLIRVIAAPQPVLVITPGQARGTPFDLTRAAYHLGNRHVAIELAPDHLKIEPDHVLADMVRARPRCSWSMSHCAALASWVTKPASTAASRPSEYEKPPTGSVGEASHKMCSRPEAGRAVPGVNGSAVGMAVIVGG